MWKGRRSSGHEEIAPTTEPERAIESRDKSIRALVQELENQTRELKSLYRKDLGDRGPSPNY